MDVRGPHFFPPSCARVSCTPLGLACVRVRVRVRKPVHYRVAWSTWVPGRVQHSFDSARPVRSCFPRQRRCAICVFWFVVDCRSGHTPHTPVPCSVACSGAAPRPPQGKQSLPAPRTLAPPPHQLQHQLLLLLLLLRHSLPAASSTWPFPHRLPLRLHRGAQMRLRPRQHQGALGLLPLRAAVSDRPVVVLCCLWVVVWRACLSVVCELCALWCHVGVLVCRSHLCWRMPLRVFVVSPVSTPVLT